MVQIAIQPRLSASPLPPVSFSCRTSKFETAAATKTNAKKREAWKLGVITASASVSGTVNQTARGHLVTESEAKKTGQKRVFFLDVNPLCYAGSTPSLRSFGRWVSLFFSQVSLSDPVIAVSSLSYIYKFLNNEEWEIGCGASARSETIQTLRVLLLWRADTHIHI